MPLAEPFESRLTSFQKLLVLRCLRPDRVLAGVQDFVAVQLGSRFIEPPPFDLAACFKESSPTTPLVFVLSPGGLCNHAVRVASLPQQLLFCTHLTGYQFTWALSSILHVLLRYNMHQPFHPLHNTGYVMVCRNSNCAGPIAFSCRR
jgi:hypothetical protein